MIYKVKQITMVIINGISRNLFVTAYSGDKSMKAITPSAGGTKDKNAMMFSLAIAVKILPKLSPDLFLTVIGFDCFFLGSVFGCWPLPILNSNVSSSKSSEVIVSSSTGRVKAR